MSPSKEAINNGCIFFLKLPMQLIWAGGVTLIVVGTAIGAVATSDESHIGAHAALGAIPGLVLTAGYFAIRRTLHPSCRTCLKANEEEAGTELMAPSNSNSSD